MLCKNKTGDNMKMDNNIMDFDQLKSVISGQRSSTITDIRNIIDSLLNRSDIDMISRIKDIELDKICNMLHHSHQLSLMMNKDFKIDPNKHEILMCSAEKYVLQNLSLRLSLDSQSRKEFVDIFISLIKTELSLRKSEDINNVESINT